MDRSMPPVKMANVCPMLTRPRATACRKILLKFRAVKKKSDIRDVATIKTTKTT
jgi:hypothetical protein